MVLFLMILNIVLNMVEAGDNFSQQVDIFSLSLI